MCSILIVHTYIATVYVNMYIGNHIVLLYIAGIYHPSIVSIQSIMRHHDTTLDTDSVFPLEQSTYISTLCSTVVCKVLL